MDFYKLIKSLDELVFEVLSWLLYYPLTLWRMASAPFVTMSEVERELTEDEEHSFDEVLGPPLFLAITLGLLHLWELVEGLEVAETSGGLGGFLADDKNLLAFRIILFGILPLIAAIRTLRHRGQPLQKGILRAPVYAQCYAAAVFAILFNAPLFIAQELDGEMAGWTALLGVTFAMLWLGWVETRWFHRSLGISRLRALGYTIRVLGEWLIVALLLSMLVS
ncbi:hypothetical protein [Sphingomicrobium flavum]|uniref:hypothetical protein n=1 Tax=Sphingomicrobium flavum TaxID=1229164 RepID=UPI0021AD9F91|nr:hypothetical protein [Sphingomicrobium flavum]